MRHRKTFMPWSRKRILPGLLAWLALFAGFFPTVASAAPSLTSNGVTVSLTPPTGDISVQLLSTLLGNNWWTFAGGGAAPSGPGAILANLFEVLDIGLLAFVSGLLVWQGVSSALATAHEGVPLGKRYHSVWAPIRAPSAFVMLFPLPWAKGLSLIQVILLVAVNWGIGLADDVWSGFVNTIGQQGGVIQAYPDDAGKQQAFMNNALRLVLTDTYLVDRANLKIGMPSTPVWEGSAGSGTYVFAPQIQGGATSGTGVAPGTGPGMLNLGAVEVKCSADMQATDLPSSGFFSGLWQDVSGGAANLSSDVNSAVAGGGAAVAGFFGNSQAAATFTQMQASYQARNNPVCQQEVQNVSQLINGELPPVAASIINQNAQNNGGPVDYNYLTSVANWWQSAQNAEWKTVAGAQAQQFQSQLTNFVNQSASQGWASSAYYFWTLENINAQANQQFKMLYPVIVQPNTAYVREIAGKYYQPYETALNAVLSHLQQSPGFISGMRNAEAAAQTGISAGATGGTNLLLSGFFGNQLDNLTNSLTSGEPMENIMSYGYGMIDAGEAAIAVVGAVKTVKSFIPGTGGKSGGLVGKAIGAATNVAGKFAPFMNLILRFGAAIYALLVPLGIFLIAEGIILAYIFPAIPSMIMIAAIIGWLFLVVELMVAAPLWAAAHAFAEGEGFASPQAKYGYMAALGIVMRPLLLTFGFVFFFFIVNIAGWFTGMALKVVFKGMAGDDIGPVAFLGLSTVAIITLFMVLKMSMKLITHLADRLPQWIGGHSGQGLGEGDIAQGAINAGSGKAQKVARDTVVGAVGVGDFIAKKGDAGGQAGKKDGATETAGGAGVVRNIEGVEAGEKPRKE